MPSRALQSFQANRKDADALVAMQGRLSLLPGAAIDFSPLHKAVVVFICAAWESYCEDLVEEGVEHIVADCSDHNNLPKELRQVIAKLAKDDMNALAPWDLAGEGWKAAIAKNAAAFVKNRAGNWNSPKPSSVDDLFLRCLGVPDISNSWAWAGCPNYVARDRLKDFVMLRGGIAHRLEGDPALLQQQGLDFASHADRLATMMDLQIGNELARITGKTYW